METHVNGISTKEARIHLTEILGRTEYAKERIRLTRRGKTVAYIVPAEDVDLLERLEEEEDRAAIALSEKEYAKGEYSTLEEVIERFKKAP